jgi:alpha-L-rhamnosidase
MVNMQDAYADPWRERGQWWGDAFIVDHVNRVSFGDYALLRRGLLMLADSITSDGRKFSMAPNNGDNNIIDYGMLWVQSLANYLRLTEDRGLAQLVYAKVDAFLNYLESLENKQTGLLNIPVEHWSKSALIDWYAYYSLPKSSTAGQSASVNAMYYGTIVDASTISAFAGDVSGAGSYSRRAENLKRSINNTLFNNTEKRYISTFVQDTVVPPSLHAQAWTLAYDVPTSENVNAVAVELMRNVYLENSVENPAPEKFEIYGTYWILEALAKSKRYNDAVRLINNYYYPMIERWGATTWWESFDINRGVSYIQSLSHGWGSSPTWFLTTRIAGVRQVSPTRWEARPPFSGVKFAEATIPLGPNKLPLSFRWDEDSCLKHKIQINAPNTFSGKVVLPYGTNNGLNGLVIIIDGKIAWANNTPLNSQITRESDGMHIPITPGNHIIDITRTTCTN